MRTTQEFKDLKALLVRTYYNTLPAVTGHISPEEYWARLCDAFAEVPDHQELTEATAEVLALGTVFFTLDRDTHKTRDQQVA